MGKVNLTTEEIQEYVALIRRSLAIGKSFARWTKSDRDDKAIEFVENFLDTVEPYITQDWFVEAFNLLLSLFKKEDPQLILGRLKDALTK